MRLRNLFVILALLVVGMAAVVVVATWGRTDTPLFYVAEALAVVTVAYLVFLYRKTVNPIDRIVGGMELLRDIDLTTRLAPTGQRETDVVVRTFNSLLQKLREEHLQLNEHHTFLKLLIEASPMGVVQCDLAGKIVNENPAAHEMMTPAVREVLLALPLGSEQTLRLSDSQVYRLSHLSFPDRGYQHSFYLIESLTAEVRRAERAAYERVIRMIAHEVNNSVGSIASAIETDYLRQRLMDMSAFVTRFAEVVKLPQPNLQLCDLSDEVEACRPFLENLCREAGVHLDLQLSDEAIPVRLDTPLFQQALINIVKNSVESRQTGGGNCRVIVTSQSEGLSSPLGEVRRGLEGSLGPSLTITDNGRGISAEAASHLFTPFYTTKPDGQGLGLMLIREILTAHGCTFTLQTDPTDHLTRFTIMFPSEKH